APTRTASPPHTHAPPRRQPAQRPRRAALAGLPGDRRAPRERAGPDGGPGASPGASPPPSRFPWRPRFGMARAMSVTYREAGADIDAGAARVERIERLGKPTGTPEVLAEVGGFAGLCALPGGLSEPVLGSGTAGV